MFRLESLQIGERTKTVINLAYIEGVVKEELVEEVLRRLNSIKVDAILESGYIQELIEDAPLSPFPTIGYTERPDAAAAAILEGRVIILTDTTPFVLIVPTYFWEALTASDDYYSHFYLGSFSRIIRYIAFIISLTLPCICHAHQFSPGDDSYRACFEFCGGEGNRAFPCCGGGSSHGNCL